MVLPGSTLRLSIRLGFLLALGAGACGAEPAGASPFLPPASANASTAPAQDTPIELRGIMETADGTMFSIYDASRKTSSWTRANEIGRDFIVRTYDASKDSVTVDFQGRTITLALHTAKVVSAPVNNPPPQMASPPPPAPQPIGGPVVLNPTPADEQRRLEAIAAEVNRRRMVRQQALQASRQAAQQNRAGQPRPQPQQVPSQQQR